LFRAKRRRRVFSATIPLAPFLFGAGEASERGMGHGITVRLYIE
jgi:hypothetical protein